MVIEEERTERSRSIEQSHTDSSPARGLRILAAVLVIAVLGLGAALVISVAGDDDSATGTAPEAVMQVLDDFATAFAESDVELMESIITEDFSGVVDVYNLDTVEPAFTVGVTRNALLLEVRDSTFSVQRDDQLRIAGDGPWVIGARETWTDPANLEEGNRIYVIVDDDGTPRLASYYYVAVKVPVAPDFAD